MIGGDAGVGKSAILSRFMTGSFDALKPSAGELYTKTILINGNELNLDLSETRITRETMKQVRCIGGARRGARLSGFFSPLFAHAAGCVLLVVCGRALLAQAKFDAYVLVYAVTSAESFRATELALEQLSSLVQLKFTPIVVAAAQGPLCVRPTWRAAPPLARRLAVIVIRLILCCAPRGWPPSRCAHRTHIHTHRRRW